MPESSQRLRDKFNFGNGNDGIAEAEKVIKDAGGTISENGVITLQKVFWPLDVADAIVFLCSEWDYAII